MSARPNHAFRLGCLAAGLVGFTGCVGTYNDVVDPCYPERYNCKARAEVIQPLEIQAANGLALEQTLYDHYFADGSDEILPGGKALLIRIARRRPYPEVNVYVQAANDPSIMQSRNLAEIGPKRKELNDKRIKTVTEFLQAIRPDVTFSVTIHDPNRVGIDSSEAATMVKSMHDSAIGNLQLQGAGGSSGGGSGGGTSSGTSGSSGGSGGSR